MVQRIPTLIYMRMKESGEVGKRTLAFWISQFVLQTSNLLCSLDPYVVETNILRNEVVEVRDEGEIEERSWRLTGVMVF